MTSQQGQLQALITEIEALLGRAAPKLPWMGSGEVSEQRRVMGQALDYLKELQSTPGDAGWGLVASQGAAIAPHAATETAAGAAADSQQVLQALLQEMQYLRAQMVQPLTSEVIALQQQRETLKNEVRQLEQERLQRAAAAQQPSPAWVNEVVTQLRSSLIADLTPKLQALPSAPPEDLTLSGFAPEQPQLAGGEPLPQLSPQQRLEQLRQIQSQTDGMLLKLDANLRAVFESLDQSIQSYCDTLNQGLGAMHGLGQQGEFIFRTFINHLAEQLQEEGSALAEQLASQQALARLQGDTDDSMDDEDDLEADVRDDLMASVIDLDDVELDDLSEFEGEDDFPLEEEVTLFQLDEEFEDWSDEEEDAAWSELASDRGEETIMQTEPIAWEVATGQAEANAEVESVTDDEPTGAYTEEIDALYDNLFGVVSAPDAAAPDSTTPVAPSDAVEATVDEQLRQADTSALDDRAPEAAIAEPTTAETERSLSAANDTSLDLDFLLEAAEPATDTAMTETPPDEPSLAALLGPEMAAELSPDDTADASPNDTITSLTELLPESEQQRQPDPFATLDETADTFIPASPDENLLDTEREVTRPQVDLSLDDDTFGMLSTDLSRLEGSDPDETLAAARLSESLELDGAPQDVIVPEFSEPEPDALDASATAPTNEPELPASNAPATADSLDLTALAMDAAAEDTADQLEAEEAALFTELFDEAMDEPAAPPAEPDNAAPPSTDMPIDFEEEEEAWMGDRAADAIATAEDLMSLQLDDSSPESADESADLNLDADLELTELFGDTDATDESDDLEWTGEISPETTESAPDAAKASEATVVPPTEKDEPTDLNLDADLELTELFGDTDATDEPDDRAFTAELFPAAPEPSLDSEKTSDATVVPPADSADAGDDGTADGDPLLFELETASEAPEDDGEDDILPRLDLDELELFDEPPLGSGSQSDRPQAPASSDSLLDFPDNPATDSDTPDAEASLEDFFNSDAPSGTASPAEPELPATAESLSLDSFFDEPATPPAVDETISGLGDDTSQEDADTSADVADKSESGDSAVTMSTLFEVAADSSDPDLTLESAFEDTELADDLAPELILADAFEEEPGDRTTDFTLDDAFGKAEASPEPAMGVTLEDAFGETEEPQEPEAIAPDLTLDDAFGEAEEPESPASGFTLDDAFGEAEEPESPAPGFTLEDAFGEADQPDAASERAPDLTLENAFSEADEAADDGPSLTVGDVFGEMDDRSTGRADAPDLTLESAFGEADAVETAPESAADLSFENAFGDDAPAAPAEAPPDNVTLDDFAAAVSSSPPESAPAPNLIPDDPLTSPEPPVKAPFLTVDDIGLNLGAVDVNDDETAPELTLETDLFGGENETATKPDVDAIAPDQLVDELELGEVPDEIAPIADDVSLETWGTTLDDVPSSPPAEDDRLDFGSLAGDFTAEPDPEEPETASPETASVEDLFADSPDLGGPTLDEPGDRQLDATLDDAAFLEADTPTAAPESPTSAADLFADLSDPDSPQSMPSEAEKTSPMLDSSPPETVPTTTPEAPPSGFAIAATADDGLQIVSDAPSDALMQSLATLPEAAIATGQSPIPPNPPRPEPESTVSGSTADGYQLSFAAASSDAAIDRALIGAPDTTAAALTDDADDTPDSSQLQREYGRRLTSWQGMVAATSLPFSTVADLSNLTIPDPDAPVSPARPTTSEAQTSPAARPTESALSLTGSVEEGFAIVLPDAPSLTALLWPTSAADSGPEAVPEAETPGGASPASEAGDAPEAAVPLTDDELATLFPPEASAVDVASAGDLDAPDLPEPSVVDEGGFSADETTADDLEAPDDATREDVSAPESSIPESPTTEEPDEVEADRAPTAPDAASTEAGTTHQDDLELSQTLESLDLSMEEIPEEEIATDEAFQFAFDDAMSAGDRSEADDEFLSADAIADLDALTTDQEILPTAREKAPAAPSVEPPEAEPAVPPTQTDIPPTTDSVFASSGRLATLGDDPEATLPDDDDEPVAPAEEWFLGIDLGTSGLSAVLMEQHSGSAHPLCWVPTNAAADTAATFRIPTVATLPTAVLAGDAPFELLSVGPAAATPTAMSSDQRLLHTLRPLLRAGIPHHDSAGLAIPRVQWSDDETLPLQQVVATVTALLRLISHPESAGLQLTAIGLEPETLAAVLANLQGVVMGLPTHWSDTYCFNLREAVLAAGIVETAGQVFFVEDAIAALLSGLPEPSAPVPTSNRSAQALYQCHWQGGTVMIGSGAACTEVGIVDLPQPLDTVSREDFKLRNLAYGGDALDLDIICQLLLPSERRQTLNAGSRRSPNRGWGWQAALPEVANAKWADLQLDGIDLPRLAEPDAGLRQQLRQHLESSPLGQSLLEAARYLKLILQHQNQYQLELADQSWRVLRRDLESRVLVPYIQRINQQMNALLSQTGLASQGINQVICTGGNASFSTIAKWLRQKFPNATIIQDTYPSNRPQTCSRVAYGLVNLCRYPQILDMPRHQYSDYFLLHEMMRVIPDTPLPLDGMLHLLEEQGINVSACQSRIVAILEGHLPPGLLPDMATRELLSRDTRTNRTYQDLAAGSLFTQQTRNIYMVNAAQRDRLQPHLTRLMADKQQSLTEPLIAQLVAV